MMKFLLVVFLMFISSANAGRLVRLGGSRVEDCIFIFNRDYKFADSPFISFRSGNAYATDNIWLHSDGSGKFTVYTKAAAYDLDQGRSSCTTSTDTLTKAFGRGLDQLKKQWKSFATEQKRTIETTLESPLCNTLPEVKSFATSVGITLPLVDSNEIQNITR